MARVSAPRLEDLVREAEVLSTLKASVPHAWKILEHEIGLARLAAAADRSAAPRPPVRKRVKLRVPAEQFPDYNFVGRLLGPRGATLKRLERDTGCRIMIRGKGSIRKDKEADVRGKPGWEHVFHEPLHVVLEVADAPDDPAAARVLARAKHLVELLLVPVPEERDALKRAQLRDLAILNGTHRPASDLLPPARSPAASPPPPTRRSSLPHKSQSHYSHHHPDPFFDAPFTSRPPYPAHSPRQPSAANTAAAASAAAAVAGSSPPASYQLPTPSQSPPPRRDYLPDLDKLHIPALDFDHLADSALSLRTFAIPAASPTIVDPEIYPYPPTPGLLAVDPQLQHNAFASPVWTPSRSLSASTPGAASPSPGPTNSAISNPRLPPRSPRPPDAHLSSSTSNASSTFLLGRALAAVDPGRSQPSALFHGSASSPGQNHPTLSLEEAFASQIGSLSDPDLARDYPASAPPRPYPTDRDSALPPFFPSSPHLLDPNEHPFDLRRKPSPQLLSSSPTEPRLAPTQEQYGLQRSQFLNNHREDQPHAAQQRQLQQNQDDARSARPQLQITVPDDNQSLHSQIQSHNHQVSGHDQQHQHQQQLQGHLKEDQFQQPQPQQRSLQQGQEHNNSLQGRVDRPEQPDKSHHPVDSLDPHH